MGCFFPLYVLGATGLDLHRKLGQKGFVSYKFQLQLNVCNAEGGDAQFPSLGVPQLSKASLLLRN